MKKMRKRLLALFTVATLLAAMLVRPTMAEGEADAENTETAQNTETTEETAAPEVTYEVSTDIDRKNWSVKQTITITIPEGMDDEVIHIDPLAGEASEDLSYARQYGFWQGGDSAEITIKIVDNSGKYYTYADGSVQLGTKEFDISNEKEVVYRMYNDALYQLIGIETTYKTDFSKAAVAKKLKTQNLNELINQYAEENNLVGVTNLEEYYCYFYGVSDLKELTADQLSKMFSGRSSGNYSDGQQVSTSILETDYPAIAEAGWRNLYTNVFTVNGTGLLDFTEGSDAENKLDNTMQSVTEETGSTIQIKLDGAKANDAYSGRDIYFSLGFDLVRAETVTLTPQSIIAYVGGVALNEGNTPELRYAVTTEADVDVDDLTFTLHTVKGDEDTATEMTVTSVEGSTLYLFPDLDSTMGEGENSDTTVLRSNYLKLVDENTSSTTNSGIYRLALRTVVNDSWDSWYITATDGKNIYLVDVDTADTQVAIREVSDEALACEDPDTMLSAVVTDLSESEENSNVAIAVVSDTTTFTTNGDANLGLLGVSENENISGYGDGQALVALLFDETMSPVDTVTPDDLKEMLIQYTQQETGDDFSEWSKQFKYMDLVNMNDGNAVVKSSEAVTVYWPYPDGITYEDADNYDFEVLHYKGFERTNTNTLDLGVIEEMDNITVTPTEYGLEFSTETFSTFALVWKTKDVTEESYPDGTLTPNPTPDLTPALNTENHYAYIVGYPDGDVHPEGTITRAEAATIFFRLLTDETREAYLTTENNFTDVNEGQWFNTAISTLAAMGILNGTSDTTFEPNRPITRAELAAICARFDGGAAVSTNVFSDISGHWAESEILRAADLGWVTGYPDGTFLPNQNITRAETMTLVNRVLSRVPEQKSDLSSDMKEWPDNMDESQWYYLAVQEATNSHDYSKDSGSERWLKLTETPDWLKYEITK